MEKAYSTEKVLDPLQRSPTNARIQKFKRIRGNSHGLLNAFDQRIDGNDERKRLDEIKGQILT